MTTLSGFIADLSSTRPTPGGGSASIVTARIGIGLVLMAARVSAQKQENPVLSNGIDALEDISRSLEADYAADIDAFESLMACYKLPKSTDEEAALRRSALIKASCGAADTPISAARNMNAALEVALRCEPKISKNIYSDLEAGVIVLVASVRAVMLNVEINMSASYMAEKKAAYQDITNEILGQAAEIETAFQKLKS